MGGWGGGGGADSNYDQCQESGECNNLNPLNKEIVWKAIKHRAGGGTVGLDSRVEGRQGEKKRIVCILFLFSLLAAAVGGITPFGRRCSRSQSIAHQTGLLTKATF